MGRMRVRVGVGAVLAVLLASCGSSSEPVATGASAQVREIRVPGGGDQVIIDQDDTVWILGGEDRVLVAIDRHGMTYESSLGDAGLVGDALAEASTGGVVHAQAACPSSDDDGSGGICDGAQLVTRVLTLEAGEIVEDAWTDPAPVVDPTAVTVASSVDGPLTFTSGATVVSESGSITLDHGERSSACATADGLYAFRTFEVDVDDTPDLDSIDLTTPIPAALDRFVDGTWQPVSGSDTTYRQDDSWSVDTRCGPNGPEIGAESSPATQRWDGEAWIEGTGDQVERPPTGTFATNGNVTVVCRNDPSSDGPCFVWTAP
jgi:hypothetical protein